MKHKFYLFLTIITLFNACNNETSQKEEEPPVKAEFLSKKIEEEKKIIIIKKTPPKAPPSPEYTFTFEDLHNNSSLIKMKENIYHFTNITQPIVMISLFSTWCPPCRGQIPHLSNLQKKFKENLFILGALVHDDIKEQELKKFIIAEKAVFFISIQQEDNLKFAHMITPKLRLKKDFPLPLMILFFKGKYFTHYEGSMPEEMIESDIQQLIEQIKKTKDEKGNRCLTY
jgi:thiol-disulfide isomerase/thioredoxin